MTIKRAAGSLGEAILRACAPLGGPANASLALGLPVSALGHYSNPHRGERIPFEIAIALERECVAASGLRPLSEFMAAQMASVDAPSQTPLAHFKTIRAAVGGAEIEIAEAVADGAVDAREAAQIAAELSASITALQRARRDFQKLAKGQTTIKGDAR